MKKTGYDLANKSDWRDVSGDQMGGPIDYVAMHKAEFKQNQTAVHAGPHYMQKGYIFESEQDSQFEY